MGSGITDYSAFLSEAIKSVEELNRSKKVCEDLEAEEQRLDRELENEKKAVSDSIGLTVKKRREEISSSYDKEIGSGQERLRKIRAKREKAKSQGVKERIAEETEVLREHNQELETQMKTLFKQDRVPAFCRSTWYYAMYMPGSVKEIGLMLLTFCVCFLAVPGIAYLLTVALLVLPYLLPSAERKYWMLALIYVLAILVFGGIYITIGNKTRINHAEALRQGRNIRSLIRTNKKKIRVITVSIRRDRDEAVYNLEKFDDEIARLEQELQQISLHKKEALNTFNTVTKNIISDEIINNSRNRIEAIEEEHERISGKLKEAQKHAKEQALYVTDQYETYLGKEFMQPEKIAELAKIMRNGQASNLSEAIAVYKSQKNG